jgi:hypothetical protein
MNSNTLVSPLRFAALCAAFASISSFACSPDTSKTPAQIENAQFEGACDEGCAGGDDNEVVISGTVDVNAEAEAEVGGGEVSAGADVEAGAGAEAGGDGASAGGGAEAGGGASVDTGDCGASDCPGGDDGSAGDCGASGCPGGGDDGSSGGDGDDGCSDCSSCTGGCDGDGDLACTVSITSELDVEVELGLDLNICYAGTISWTGTNLAGLSGQLVIRIDAAAALLLDGDLDLLCNGIAIGGLTQLDGSVIFLIDIDALADSGSISYELDVGLNVALSAHVQLLVDGEIDCESNDLGLALTAGL